MPEKEVAGQMIEVNDEGYMTNPSQWNEEIADGLAGELEIELSDNHWKVITFLRKDYKEKGSIPTIRRIGKVGGVETKLFYKLFPGGPVKKAAKIAGLKKPESCI